MLPGHGIQILSRTRGQPTGIGGGLGQSPGHPSTSGPQDRSGNQGLPWIRRVLPEVYKELCQGGHPIDGTLEEGDKVHLDGSTARRFRKPQEGFDYSTHPFSAGLGAKVPRHPKRFRMVPWSHLMAVPRR